MHGERATLLNSITVHLHRVARQQSEQVLCISIKRAKSAHQTRLKLVRDAASCRERGLLTEQLLGTLVDTR